VTASKRARRVPLGAEVALAFAAGAASFALVAVALAVVDSDVLVVLLGAVSIVAVVAMARFWGIAYAVPGAMAGFLSSPLSSGAVSGQGHRGFRKAQPESGRLRARPPPVEFDEEQRPRNIWMMGENAGSSHRDTITARFGRTAA